MADLHPAPHVAVTQLEPRLHPDPARTVVRPFLPSDPERYADPANPRPARIVRRVLALDEESFQRELNAIWVSLDERHRNVREMLLRRFDEVAQYVEDPASVPEDRRLLVGGYLSAEYSFEAAALFNPSIVAFPEGTRVEDGEDTRFLISLRGIGEGHLSSVTFRTGTWKADGSVALDPSSEVAVAPLIGDLEADGDVVELDCGGSHDPSETVLFPVLPSQSRGIEDVRLTPMTLADGSRTIIGTYTAFGDKGVRQELFRTDDFAGFRLWPTKGDLADAKGLAVFPRQVGGRYLALGRQDSENVWLATSDDLVTWNGGTKLLEPRYPWEIIQMGNCGAPIEIAEGWLVLTHGVGVVRNYCMGAALLDRDDPSRVLARLPMPLLEPEADDRDGYVPNVVYSCGALVRGRQMLLPYGVADEFTRFCSVDLDDLVRAMEPVD